MEFCPSCKSYMIPQNNKKKAILVCRSCGFEIKKFSPEKYRIIENLKREPSDIIVIEESRKKSTEEQRKYITDLYGNDAYGYDE
jgi:DNA-directed RNA polymerase subunit M/transcription elongation factor TFIIS